MITRECLMYNSIHVEYEKRTNSNKRQKHLSKLVGTRRSTCPICHFNHPHERLPATACHGRVVRVSETKRDPCLRLAATRSGKPRVNAIETARVHATPPLRYALLPLQIPCHARPCQNAQFSARAAINSNHDTSSRNEFGI